MVWTVTQIELESNRETCDLDLDLTERMQKYIEQ